MSGEAAGRNTQTTVHPSVNSRIYPQQKDLCSTNSRDPHKEMKGEKERDPSPCTPVHPKPRHITLEGGFKGKGAEAGHRRHRQQCDTPKSTPITFGSPENKAKPLMVPFLQDSHLIIDDIITGKGKQG